MVTVAMVVVGGIVAYDVISARAAGTATTSQTVTVGARTVWALALLFLLLAMLADIVPEIAGPFAVLVMLSVGLGRKSALAAITDIASGKKPSKPTRVAPSAISPQVHGI